MEDTKAAVVVIDADLVAVIRLLTMAVVLAVETLGELVLVVAFSIDFGAG